MVGGLGNAEAHSGSGPQHTVEAGVIDHLDDRRHASPFLTDHPSPRALARSPTRSVGEVAELALQALKEETVAAPVRYHTWHKEARESPHGQGKHKEHVAHRRRA